MSFQEFQKDVVKHLETCGISTPVADHVAELLDSFLNFNVGNSPSNTDFDYYICFAFGNEPDEFANLLPGEVNEKLAKVVQKLYKKKKRLIIAQWEIGELLKKDKSIAKNDIISIGQSFDKVFGKPKYQSTKTFVAEAVKRLGTDKKLFVVAQWYHFARCVREIRQATSPSKKAKGGKAKSANLTPVTNQDIMPKDFCVQEFGQLWTSSEERFVLHTLIGSLNAYRDKMSKEWENANP